MSNEKQGWIWYGVTEIFLINTVFGTMWLYKHEYPWIILVINIVLSLLITSYSTKFMMAKSNGQFYVKPTKPKRTHSRKEQNCQETLLVECPTCGAQTSLSVHTCPICGTQMTERLQP